MYPKLYSDPDIYKIDIPLPDNPLKNLNCYVIKTADKNLIIDTGFNRPECLQALENGLSALHIDKNKTELFLTHLHSDHIGLASHIMKENAPIYMSTIDYDYFLDSILGNNWESTEQAYYREGFPKEHITVLRDSNPARSYAPDGTFEAITVNDGDTIQVGNYTFQCILTPGHTPGHMCLYFERDKLLFTGDHILFDITPNITSWHGVHDPLSSYMESLKKIRKMEIKTALPAHRKNDMDIYERIDEILHHHRIRLEDIINIVSDYPELTACQIASKMKWSMRGKNWNDFPISQRWFAVGETIAHVEYLMARDVLKQNTNKEGIYTYTLKL